MLIPIATPTGLVPKLDPETLPTNAAQDALNCNFNSQAIVGLRGPVTYGSYTAASAIKGAFFYNDTSGWRGYAWGYDVDAIRGPALQDTHKRFYWTGNNGGTKEFKFALSTQADGSVTSASALTSYKVGVIDSRYWDDTLSALGITFEVRNKGVPVEISTLSGQSFKYYIADTTGALYQEITPSSAVGNGTATRGWYDSYTVTLSQGIDAYAEKTVSTVTYKQATEYVTLGEFTGEKYTANVWRNSSGTIKYLELVDPAPANAITSVGSNVVFFLFSQNLANYVDSPAEFYTGNTTLKLRTASTFSADNDDLPAGLASSSTTSALPDKLNLAVVWEFDYDGQRYKATIYEDNSLSGSFDILGGISASITRTSNSVFVVKPEFGIDLPIETRSYIATFVNRLSEESEPSKAVEVSLNPGKQEVVMVVNTTTFAAKIAETNLVTGRYPLHGVRVYRTATDSAGTAEFLYAFSVSPFVPSGLPDADALPGDTYPVPTGVGSNWEIADAVPASALGAACSTQEFITSTHDLQNLQCLTAVHNGMTAAISGNEVWVCEPYQPWAYKSRAIYTLPRKCVSVVAADNGFYVLTDGSPYYFSGAMPDELMYQKVNTELPCISKRAACAVGASMLYLSPDGPVVVSGLNAEPEPSWSREKWRDMYTANVEAGYSMGLAVLGHRIIAYYQNQDYSAGTVIPGYIYDMEDKAWSYISTRFDYALPVPAGVLGRTHDALLYTDGGLQFKLFAEDGSNGTWIWHSKDFVMPKPTNFGVLQIRGSGNVVAKVYSNGTLRHTSSTVAMTAEGVKLRLPGGFLDTKWSVRFEGAAGSKMIAAYLATTVAELRNV